MSTSAHAALRYLLINALPDSLFTTDVSLEAVKANFKTYVKLVEVENHSYCNRICWFCPNSTIDRRSETIPINPILYKNILANLAEIDYSETMVWARYHEPMADDTIYANLTLARTTLPRAFLTIHTNGDYLNRASVRQLEETGLNQVRINLYVANGQSYTEETVEKMVKQILDRTGLTLTDNPDTGGRQLTGSRLHMPVNIPDFSRGMSSRGGLLVQVGNLTAYRRTSACLSPLQHVVIDYNGIGVLCCQVRSDAAEHTEARIGDLNREGYSLFHFYRDLAAARKGLTEAGVKEGVCTTCTINEGGPYRFGRSSAMTGPLSLLTGGGRITGLLWKRRHRRYDPEI